MKTAQIVRRFVESDWGGTETMVLQSSLELARRGHSTEILASMALASETTGSVSGIPVRRFQHSYPYLGLDSRAIARLDQKGGNLFSFDLMRHLRRRDDIDLFHLHTGKRMGGIVRSVALAKKKPYVVSLHGGVFDVPAQEAERWTEPTRGTLEWGRALGWWVGSRRVLDDADAILCVGASEAREVSRRFPRKRVEYLPNGVNARRFASGNGPSFRERHGIGGDARLLVVVGRIDPQKGQLLAVEALSRLGSTWQLALVGHVTSPAYLEAIRNRIEASNLRGRVTIVEGLAPDGNDLVDAYHAADLVLVPSVHEPFGIVVLEAWAAGRAVIASRVGGLPGFVEDGRDGILLTPGDIDEWTATIAGLSLESAAALGDAGRAKARREFDWTRVADRLEVVYEEISHARPVR